MQRTLALFRPAAVETGLAHKLLSCAVDTGLRVSLRKTLLLSVKVWLGLVSATEDRHFVIWVMYPNLIIVWDWALHPHCVVLFLGLPLLS